VIKSLLLPKEYTLDITLQTTILSALSPYRITQRNDIINPKATWDLTRAWEDAVIFLRRSTWILYDNPEYSPEIRYEMQADSECEIDCMHTVIAGIVAYQLMEPESGISIRQVKHKPGGEVALIVTTHVADLLKKLFPKARFI
jgi:hypothetical protein